MKKDRKQKRMKKVAQRKPSIATATKSSELIGMSRVKPLRGAEGALDIPISSERP
jgi:hypothetical protein